VSEQRWPKPTTKPPSLRTLEQWAFDEKTPRATDGCKVELDGVCVHGHPSWALRLGYV
jgi:hypothetical protein